MTRWSGVLVLLATLAVCSAGPVGSISSSSNVTSGDPKLEDGSCVVGSTVYSAGESVPGAGPCERCRCEHGAVACETQRCESRPGCKALHRPDLCCPLYQCECEQEGRVYGNGEKLVDPLDPCRVCYCQGGEVVCRRIACFLRDDCRPRLVPGRCCPEYDNCPIRGVTALPGMAASISGIPVIEDLSTTTAPPSPKPNLSPVITIKEITPVSEIPVITEVKIKEILPSPSMEVAEYSSSKSPLIPRQATEKSISKEVDAKTEASSVTEVTSTLSVSISELPPESITKLNSPNIETKMSQQYPAKISIPMQDNSKIESPSTSILSTVGTMSSDFTPTFKTTKSPVIDDDDTSLFDHNPAFPPLPDDLSVIGNHDEEIIDQNMDGVHILNDQDDVTNVVSSKEPAVTTAKMEEVTTENVSNTSTQMSTTKLAITTESAHVKQSPMLNLRSAISTEILDLPSSLPEDITGELDETTEISSAMTEEISTRSPHTFVKPVSASHDDQSLDGLGQNISNVPKPGVLSPLEPIEQTINPIVKSNIATEVTTQTELSSLPIETSDQKPHAILDNRSVVFVSSTAHPVTNEVLSTKISEEATPTNPPRTENFNLDTIETTEFIPIFTGSSETSTDGVELIKVLPETKPNAAIIETSKRRNNDVLTDIINIVDDVASIGDTTEETETDTHAVSSNGISESEELIPVNAGYKSKNNNWNVNSITELPQKSKVTAASNKPKIVEIDDDESQIADSPPPNDKVEPTTRRPIIDNVSDDMPENKTEKKDIEIITKSYVPTINRRPTKVVLKKNEDVPVPGESQTEGTPVSVSSELTTESASSTAKGTQTSVEISSSETEGTVSGMTSATSSPIVL